MAASQVRGPRRSPTAKWAVAAKTRTGPWAHLYVAAIADQELGGVQHGDEIPPAPVPVPQLRDRVRQRLVREVQLATLLCALQPAASRGVSLCGQAGGRARAGWRMRINCKLRLRAHLAALDLLLDLRGKRHG